MCWTKNADPAMQSLVNYLIHVGKPLDLYVSRQMPGDDGLMDHAKNEKIFS
jgi:hypothetical protein